MRARGRRVPDGTFGPAAVTRPATLVLPLLGIFCGCTVGPDFLRPAAPADPAYTADGTAEQGTGDQHFAMGQKIAGDWWTLYRSAPLNAVLEQAIAGNRSLAGAQATLVAAQEALNQAMGGLYPQIDAGAGALRQHINGAQFGLKKLPPQFPPYSNIFRVGGTVSYAVDMVGGTRRAIEQSGALADAQDFALDAAYLTLTGNAVVEALTIASLRSQLATVEGIIADDQTNLRLVEREVGAGVATQLDIETARSQLASDRTLLPPLRQQVNVARHALAVLAGRAPSHWTPPDFDLDQITLPADLPLSLPSDLVRQRPDILASEAQLHAASAAIGVATAQLYPSLTLTGALTEQAISVDTLFHGAGAVWTIGGNLTAPLFHGGALEAQRRRAEATYDAALAAYEQTVLQAFAQVADVLDALGQDAELLAEQQSALQAAQASLDLTRRAYTLGSVGVLQVLDAQRLVEQARLGYVRARAQRYLDTAQLFLAMGGGWWNWRERGAEAKPITVSAPAR
jgi:NodT family efflux transporter outer membrane factor (OMF) lipoprotein